MSDHIDFYFDIISPYAYIAHKKIQKNTMNIFYVMFHIKKNPQKNQKNKQNVKAKVKQRKIKQENINKY